MHRWGRLLAALAVVATACASSSGSASQPQTRTVRVDHNFDEFAGSFLGYFPQEIDARPGDTIRFKQDWTGEGHSVTLGTLVDKAILPVRDIIRSGHIPDEPPPEVQEALKVLPEMVGEDYTVSQAAAQPCFLDREAPPTDPAVACPKREQPAFDGRQAYYSSGLIPFQGTEGNRFELRLADDITPGTYTFYCSLHGPLQSGEIHVKAKGTKVPSQASVDRRGEAELHKLSTPLTKAFEDAKAGKGMFQGQQLRGNLAGVATDTVQMAYIDEFVPNRINTKVGEKVTWTFVGPHTVSFDVPPYFPEFLVTREGVVTFNPKAHQAFGGPGEPPPRASPEDPLPAVDAGRWDGSYVISSGMFVEGTYSLTFTKPGRYRYACLVHPRMVGEVVVS